MYVFFDIKDTRCCITIHSFNISGYRTVHISKIKALSDDCTVTMKVTEK